MNGDSDVTVRQNSGERREQILDAALIAFSHRGYHETSMVDIADAIGVTKPVLYQHFDSKRELYLELLEVVGNDLIAAITKAAIDSDDGREQTERGMIAYFGWVLANQDAFNLLFGGGARLDEEFAGAIRRVERAIADAIAPLIAADISESVRRTMAYGLVGMSESVSRHLVASGDTFDPVAIGRQIGGLAWAGLRSLGQSRNTQPR
ncbi:MAG: hypothetical protein RL419_219 [Actinomycetota bacterium]